MAITRSIKVVNRIGSPSVPMLHGLEGASQTFNAGAPVKRGASSSAGYLVTCTAGGGAGTIVGFAQQDGANTTRGTDLRYTPALPGVIFEAQVHHASSASMAKIQTIDYFLQFGLAVSSGNWYINKADTSAAEVVIVGFKDAVGTTNGVVYATIKSNYTVFDKT